ncbi:PAS domain S-box protein [Flammeovirga yaeyamensis]|uniref:PAS domain S-box protein n=2 Tax=Flammeovirga yaeyamensis TaxID=367791 RepID=A0AAX1N7P2_9BACT|nr:PAS domain S-box protein [Flammeovirga yaeyamensis]QWG03477.1 PAS domain S-box protein [Flammeovirga yaeyamensis]
MFFQDLKIRTKITIIMLMVVTITVAIISFLSYIQTEDSVERRYSETFDVISTLKSEQIDQKFKLLEQNLKYISKSALIVSSTTKLKYLFKTKSSAYKDSTYYAIKRTLDNDLFPKQIVNGYSNIIISDDRGSVLYTSYTFPASVIVGDRNKTFEKIIKKAKTKTYFSEPFNTEKGVHMYIVSPRMKSRYGELGHVIILYSLQKNIYPIVENRTGLGDTGEILLSRMSEGAAKNVTIISPLKSSQNLLTEVISEGDPKNIAIQKAAKGDSKDFGYDIDWRGKKTISYWNYIPTTKWGLVVKIDYDEIKSGLNGLILTFVYTAIIIILIVMLVAVTFSKFLTSPIIRLKNRLNYIAKGILPHEVSDDIQNDEIGEMQMAVQEVVNGMKRTANFSEQIGDGNYDAVYSALSEDDTLGNALISMRDSIQKAEKRDYERNWIITGEAEIGQILRTHNDLIALGDEVIAYTTEKINAVQGAFYVVEGATDELSIDKQTIELVSTYAYNKKRFLKKQFKFAEGLVGQAAIEMEMILRTEIPSDYLSITSGLLGEKKPRSVLIMPLIANEKVYGLLEFASLDNFSPMTLEFVKEISQIIARTIFNIKINERTVRLLKESQQMSSELSVQQEILRQNAEEMESTQEELQRTNHRLEEQVEEVKHSQNRLQSLLENASEVITIFDKDSKIKFVSPSSKHILGYKPQDLIDTSYLSNLHKDSLDHVKEFINNLVESEGRQTFSLEYRYKLQDGRYIWLEATGINLTDDPAVEGIVINAQDITERKQAEVERRMRTQMQALSENSLDLIQRLNAEGHIFYTNPTIEDYTGLAAELFTGQQIDNTSLPENIIQLWKEMLIEVSSTSEKCTKEVEFPTNQGTRFMTVTAIPEFNDEKEFESALFVSHDITERKKVELEILLKNKKITESINYAKRIQGAIIPNTEHIKKDLNDCFIFYKPRDVVSGDFPWYYKKGKDIYIAAVDCTGHGVPGALISLIGYFLLNDIVSSNEDIEPGEVLNKLHEGVTKTLRQDSNSSTRDGMDIALSKIDLESKTVQYAGAHRPLYVYKSSNKEFTQIKGDKFPVGGEYKTRTSFSTHQLDLEQGDEIFMFSDGYPDQFGGEENRKFGAKRIRELIVNTDHSSMEDIATTFSNTFENWKGNFKQTDDVIMIGIGF